MSYNLLMHKGFTDIMMFLFFNTEASKTRLSKIPGVPNYSYIGKTLAKMEKQGLVDSYVKGRERRYLLTQKGNDLSVHLNKVLSFLEPEK